MTFNPFKQPGIKFQLLVKMGKADNLVYYFDFIEFKAMF